MSQFATAAKSTKSDSRVKSAGKQVGSHDAKSLRSVGVASFQFDSVSIQPKLKISRPDDPYEQEADRVAEQIIRMQVNPATPNATGKEVSIDRKCKACKTKEEEKGEKLLISRKSSSTLHLNATDRVAEINKVRSSNGHPLDATTKTFVEQRFGFNFSNVRIHADQDAARSANSVNARAYTMGSDIVFGEGQYQPYTLNGKQLLAHELTHVIQQNSSHKQIMSKQDTQFENRENRGEVNTKDIRVLHSIQSDLISRQEAEEVGGTKHAEFLQSGWIDINELGIAYKEGGEGEGGANLREFADTKSRKLRWLPQNTKVFILKHHPITEWYAVTVVGSGGGQFGYIYDKLIARYLPDPDAEIYKTKSGDTPITIAADHYADKGFNVWGKDARYVVNALAWVNARAKHNFEGEAGIKKPSTDAAWWTTSAQADVWIWLPGAQYLNAIYEQVAKHGGGTGSLTADLCRKIKKAYEYVAYGLAFVGGLVHGFVKSIYDAVAGLVETIVDVLVSVFTGNVLSDAKNLWEAISKLTWDDIKNSVSDWWAKWEKKLTSDDPWVAGHAHGYLTGYIMAEAAQLLLSAGTLAVAKSALMASRLGKAIQATSAYSKFVKGMEKIGEAGAKTRKLAEKAGETVRRSKPFTTLKVAKEWAVTTLKLSAEIAKDLTLDGINRLRLLSDAALERISRLSNTTKRKLLGCRSNCKVDLKKIENSLEMTDDDIERFIGKIEEKAESPVVKGGKEPRFEGKKVPTKKRRRLEAEDIPRLPGEKLGDAVKRINKIVGKRISDYEPIKSAWERARRHVLKTKTLAKENVAEVYGAVRNKFWEEIRNEPEALKILRESGFYLPQKKSRAAFLGEVRSDIPRQEITLSLDHAFEKARGENWRMALDPENLVFEFHNPNSFREIIQMRHPELRSP